MTCLPRTQNMASASCAFPRRAARLVCWFGILFSAFALAEWTRLGVAAACLLICWTLRRPGCRLKFKGAWIAVRRGEYFAAMMLLAAAIVFRMACYLLHERYGLGIFQSADANQFWKWSQEMAAGSFPEVKSWTTVAAYALCIKLFGNTLTPAYILNFMLHIATAGALLGFGCRLFGRGAGWLAAAVYLLSPTFVLMTFSTLSEHFFFLFVALSLLCAERWAPDCRNRWLFGMSVCVWLAVWSRGEGLLVLGALGVCLGGLAVCRRTGWRSVLSLIVLYVLLSLSGALIGVSINLSTHGICTFFCSNDNYWPRLHGTNRKTKGRVTNKDLIYEQYSADHPGDPEGVMAKRKPNYCPPELIPYIKAETTRRWKAMSLPTKIRFIVEKEHFDWAHAFAGSGRTPVGGASAVLYEAAPAIILVLSLFGFARRLRRGECPMAWLEAAPLLVIGGMCGVLALYESNIRYGTMLLVFMPLYAQRGGKI